jgi:hypothetical protein
MFLAEEAAYENCAHTDGGSAFCQRAQCVLANCQTAGKAAL